MEKKEDKNFIEIEKFEEINNKYIHLNADFDNYKKRTLKEKMDLMKYANENILLKFLPILDNFERAKKSIKNDIILEGIDIIYNDFIKLLKQQGIEEIESLGKKFDTDLHEAINILPTDEKNKGKIIDVVEKGYKLKGKVIRVSKVIVGK